MNAQAVTEKPRMRGRLHQIAFICSIPMGLTLVAVARTGVARAATAVYAFSVAALFGVSASYHRIPWTPRARRWMQRLDHSTIFVLIAGTYTPFSVLALRGAWRVALLAVVWGIAMIGVALKMAKLERMHGAGMVMYIGLGWAAIVAFPQLVSTLGAAELTLLVLGGLLYTVGAVLFAMGKPNPSPRVFGYHEVWHSMVIGGSLCHYATILLLALAAK